MDKAQAIRFREHLDLIIETLQDEDALNVSDLFPMWKSGKVYAGSESENPSRVQYLGILYKCLQGHTSQDDWTPNIAISLWVRVDNPAEEWPEWRQPTGAHDTYELGAKVSHNGKHWINTGKDGNEYEPGIWGWDEVNLEEE